MPQDAAQPGELREDDDFTTALYRAAIGPVNTSYYLPLFTAWEGASRLKPCWNTAAGLWTLGWLVFRKMGGAALAYVGALVGSMLLVFGIGRLFFDLSETGHITMFLLWLLTAVLVPGLWGNVWFHSHCRKRMAIALAAHTEVAQSCAALARQSSQPRRAMVVGSVQVGLLVALGLGTLQFSSLMQRAGVPLASTANLTPQMASGKVKEIAVAAATASNPLKPTSAAITSSAATNAPATLNTVPAAPKPAAKVASVPAKIEKTASAAVPAMAVTLIGRYGVNVGLFAKVENAQRVKAQLEAAQFVTEVDTVNMQRGPRMRIRVGPFATEALAEEAAVKIRALGFEAKTYRD